MSDATRYVSNKLDQGQDKLTKTLDTLITPQGDEHPVAGIASAGGRIIGGAGVVGAQAATVGLETTTNIIADPADGLEALGRHLAGSFTPLNVKPYKAASQPKPQLTDTMGGKIDYAADGVAYQLDRGIETLSENLGKKVVKDLGGDPNNLGAKAGALAINTIAFAPKVVAGTIATIGKTITHVVGGAAEGAAVGEHGVGQIFVGAGNLLADPKARIDKSNTDGKNNPDVSTGQVDYAAISAAKMAKLRAASDAKYGVTGGTDVSTSNLSSIPPLPPQAPIKPIGNDGVKI